MEFTNDTALITGASGGIGEEFAVQLAARGANLVLVARRADKLTELRDRLLTKHPGIIVDVVAADLAVPGTETVVARGFRALAQGRLAHIRRSDLPLGQSDATTQRRRRAVPAHLSLSCRPVVAQGR